MVVVPQGAPIKAPIRTTPLETRTNEVEMAINDVTGVTGTLAVRQSLKGEDTLVCFVTPASISGESILQELTNNKVDFYLFPDIIMPVESLPNSAQFATLEDLVRAQSKETGGEGWCWRHGGAVVDARRVAGCSPR